MTFNDTTIAMIFYLIVMNYAGYKAVAWDKHCARNRLWRLPERTLLLVALIGGSAGTVYAQQTLRHKTRKQPFRTLLWLIVLLHLGILAALVYW